MPPPGDEYSAVGGGGKLKLKGGVKDGRVDKKKKKKKEKEKDHESTANDALKKDEPVAEAEHRGGDEGEVKEGEDDGPAQEVPKTEAERNYEEQKRKRVCFHFISNILSF
jgi:protein FAM32A